ncbi:MAG: NAD-dependent epimerase/dehydratase family protein [Vicingaceae bacterium]
MKTKRKALVTGANGFIGYHLCRHLKDNDWEVIALIHSDRGKADLENLDVKIVNASVTDLDSMMAAVPAEVDAFFHLAGVTSQWYKDFNRQFEVNVNGTRIALDVASEKQAKRFVHISSIMAFGLHIERITEKTESNAFELNNNYSRTKLKAEKLAINAYRSGMDVVILNPSHIIGPKDRHNHIQLFEAIMDDNLPGIPPGKGMFCHVADAVLAFEQAALKGQSGEKYLIGGHCLSFKELSMGISKALGKKKNIRVIPKWAFKLLLPYYSFVGFLTNKEPLLTPGKVLISCADIACDDSKAVRAFGLKYLSVDRMITDTLDWLTESRSVTNQ